MVSWFMSPWEAARISMEAQRSIALQFLGFAFSNPLPKEQRREDRGLGENVAAVTHPNPNMGSPDHPVAPSAGVQPMQKRTVAARSNTQTAKKATGTRNRKSRRSKRKR
jgi:hypothetical protein